MPSVSREMVVRRAVGGAGPSTPPSPSAGGIQQQQTLLLLSTTLQLSSSAQILQLAGQYLHHCQSWNSLPQHKVVVPGSMACTKTTLATLWTQAGCGWPAATCLLQPPLAEAQIVRMTQKCTSLYGSVRTIIFILRQLQENL